MQNVRLQIRYITANNCFAYLPEAVLSKLDTKENVIEILHDNKIHYASCNIKPIPTGVLCLGTTFARALNIDEGDEVFVSSVKDVPSISSITVLPHTQSDREILELQMEKMQSILLGQIRIVAKNQPIVMWVSKFSTITFTTETLTPDFPFGKLAELTEIYVDSVALSDKKSKTSDPVSTVKEAISNSIKKLLPLSSKETTENVSLKNYEFLQSFRNKSKPRVFRVHFLPKQELAESRDELNDLDTVMRSPYNVFVSRGHLPQITKFPKGFGLFTMKKVPRDPQNVTSTNFLKPEQFDARKLSAELTAKVFILEDILESYGKSVDKEYFNLNTVHNTVYVSESVRLSLKVKTGDKMILRQIETEQEYVPRSIEVYPRKEPVPLDAFRKYLEKYSEQGLIINSGAAIVLDNGDCCVLKIVPEEHTFATVTPAVLQKLQIRMAPAAREYDFSVNEDSVPKDFNLEKISTRYLTHIIEECRTTMDLSLGLRPLKFEYNRENILICGEIGSGKTTICRILAEKLRNPPYFVHSHTIDCRSVKGKKAEVLQKLVTTALSECVYYQPSILFLDDIECISNASSSDEENTPDAVNAARVADMLVNTVTQYQESHYVSIIGTCASVNRIGQKLRPARGAHFFRTVLTIPNLEKADRIDILQLMLGDKLYVPGDVNWDYYGNKTEGWTAQDLVDMAEKATFSAWKRHGNAKEPIVITEEDVSTGLRNCTPLSLQGIQLYKGSDHVWSDIGGLADVKRSLVEMLQWPLKYPEIFKNAPIKLQSGVLLYGMPGTGKTMLAKAIANECGVNLISVKGPELLSKYIGVSEESVRNVFERAHRAKPCVLFFDEFDSLAPRRGHDSTGVTDRVVNQLLTQLDGVEDREGVAVVAASSRPDLLDPALLRPGRLDKALLCPLPDKADREEILAALCKSHKVNAQTLNLEEVADLAAGFTGADLNAVLTQARLSAFEDAVSASPDGKIEPDSIKVTQDHLLQSFKSTQPSLSSAEKAKYNRIYARFSKGQNITEEIVRSQKATLA